MSAASRRRRRLILRMIDRGEAGSVVIAHFESEPIFLYSEIDDRGWSHELAPSSCGQSDCEHEFVVRLVRLRP
jgi:hypothetical protein